MENSKWRVPCVDVIDTMGFLSAAKACRSAAHVHPCCRCHAEAIGGPRTLVTRRSHTVAWATAASDLIENVPWEGTSAIKFGWLLMQLQGHGLSSAPVPTSHSEPRSWAIGAPDAVARLATGEATKATGGEGLISLDVPRALDQALLKFQLGVKRDVTDDRTNRASEDALSAFQVTARLLKKTFTRTAECVDRSTGCAVPMRDIWLTPGAVEAYVGGRELLQEGVPSCFFRPG